MRGDKVSVYINSLVLIVQLLNNEVALKTRVPLEITFKNAGSTSIRVLDTFKPEEAVFFFRLKLARANGMLVPTRGGGKVDLDPSLVKYREIGPGASFSTTLNLIDFLGDRSQLQPGEYSLLVTYSNQYGTDCFKGTVSSQTIRIQLPAVPKG
jgi:hypothetical protein